jgi:ketosteroid isomerase-like protein
MQQRRLWPLYLSSLLAAERDTAWAMSKKVEALRAFIEAFNRHDFDDAVRYLHPEVEIYPAIGGQLDVGRRYRGRDQSRQLLATISEGVKNNVEIEDVIEGESKMLQVERWHGRGRQGIETPVEFSSIYTFRDGLVVRLDSFRDQDQAREAAGLPE